MFFILVSLIMTGLSVYLWARLVIPLPLPRWVQRTLGLALLLCANKMLLSQLLFGGLLMSDASPAVLILSGWLHACILLGAMLLLVSDLLSIVFRKSRVRVWGPVSRAVVVAVLSMGLAAGGIWEALKVPDVREIVVPLSHLPPALENLRIVQLSDLHMGPLYGRDRLEQIVERVNALKPDVVAISGDVVDGSPTQLAHSVAPLAELKARYGVYLAVGNHEYYSGLEPWLAAFARLGFTVLFNSHVVVPVGADTLVLAGLSDRVTLRGQMGELPNPTKALAGAPAPTTVQQPVEGTEQADQRAPQVLRILLDHQPAGAPDNATHGVGLQLSGHTHGGLLLPLQELIARANNGFVSGLYDVGEMSLYVSNGAGLWAGFPVRLGVPSEIAVLRLVNKGSADK